MIPDGGVPGLVVAGVLGLVLGSFLNVCIVRWGAEPKESVVRPRSRCPRCGYQLAAADNIPVLSWLLLRGRCRSCRQPIPVMYPLVELAVAAIWAGAVWRYGVTLAALHGAVFLSLLLGIALTDARRYVIPDEFSLGGLGLALALAGGGDRFVQALIGAAVGFGLLWAIGALGTKIFRQDAMGGGDMKMMAMVGAFLDWKGVLLTVFLGAVAGTVVFVPITLVHRGKLVPFGIFLALGAAAVWLVGPDLIRWYAAYARGA